MKVTIGKATLGLMMLLSAGFLITLLVSADDQHAVAPYNEESTLVSSSVGIA